MSSTTSCGAAGSSGVAHRPYRLYGRRYSARVMVVELVADGSCFSRDGDQIDQHPKNSFRQPYVVAGMTKKIDC